MSTPDPKEAIEELELLARWRWYIEGSGFNPSAERSNLAQRTGRPGIVDEHHEEVATALKARSALERLRNTSSRGKKHAAFLEANLVERGELARKQSASLKAMSPMEKEHLNRKYEKQLLAALNAYQKLR
jgi:hypothetical protein